MRSLNIFGVLMMKERNVATNLLFWPKLACCLGIAGPPFTILIPAYLLSCCFSGSALSSPHKQGRPNEGGTTIIIEWIVETT